MVFVFIPRLLFFKRKVNKNTMKKNNYFNKVQKVSTDYNSIIVRHFLCITIERIKGIFVQISRLVLRFWRYKLVEILQGICKMKKKRKYSSLCNKNWKLWKKSLQKPGRKILLDHISVRIVMTFRNVICNNFASFS